MCSYLYLSVGRDEFRTGKTVYMKDTHTEFEFIYFI